MARGTLFVVATPIGNLEDITKRALRILGEVSLVAAEDTRRTGNLLRHYGISTPLLSLHEHNEHQRAARVIDRLGQGLSVALVSDAGTPGISDPGARLVRSVRQAGFPVIPIPGPSAVLAALSASGVSADRFVFGGFPPIRSKDRKQWWAWAGETRGSAFVFFEAPHRVLRTLSEARTFLGNRPITVGRELTKLHEEWLHGSADELSLALTDPVGEFVFVAWPQKDLGQSSPPLADDEIVAEFGRLAKIERESTGESRRNLVRELAQKLGLTANEVYAALERARKLVE